MTEQDTTARCLHCGADRVATYVEAGVRRFAPHRYSGVRYPALCLASDNGVEAQADAAAQVEAYWAGSIGSAERITAALRRGDRYLQ